MIGFPVVSVMFGVFVFLVVFFLTGIVIIVVGLVISGVVIVIFDILGWLASSLALVGSVVG